MREGELLADHGYPPSGKPFFYCPRMEHETKEYILSSDYAARLKLITSLWPVACAIRSKVRVGGRVRPFSSRTTLACAVLSFLAAGALIFRIFLAQGVQSREQFVAQRFVQQSHSTVQPQTSEALGYARPPCQLS
jgi:uncharacterized tellurite resistance protein B-like protein